MARSLWYYKDKQSQ